MNTQRTFRLSLFLRGLYFLIWLLARISLPVFFRRVYVNGKQHLRAHRGAMILVSNHPNTLMDVLVPGANLHRILFFLANYSLFRHPVSNWILTRLYCIPIKRKEDMIEGEERNNSGAFEQSFLHLEHHGALFIAPEGVSWTDRFVRPLKTGTARIALEVESRNNWQLGLKIQPVGLSYSASRKFRSEVVLQAGTPIVISDWADAYQQAPEKAIQALTDLMQTTLQDLTIHTRDAEGDIVAARWDILLRNSLPLGQKAAFERSQRLARTQLDNLPLKQATNAYFDALEGKHLTDLAVWTNSKQGLFFRTIADAFLLTLGFPLFGLALVFWALPCFLPWLLVRTLKIYPGYDATIKVLSGIFITFPLALWALWHFSSPFLPNGWWYFVVVLVVVILGLIAERYLDVLNRFIARWHGGQLPLKERAALLEARAGILGEIG